LKNKIASALYHRKVVKNLSSHPRRMCNFNLTTVIIIRIEIIGGLHLTIGLVEMT